MTDTQVTREFLLDEASDSSDGDPVGRVLHRALTQLPVTGRLINLTSGSASEEDSEQDPIGIGPAQELSSVCQKTPFVQAFLMEFSNEGRSIGG